ncbi:MAG: proton-conducting transporter membrane subunit, partial [Chromatiales bacterium]|nr:proton-conducting transporter membrane subunit [Chromatiales bacterium]
MSSIPPFAPFFLAAALTLVVGGRLRAVVLVALPILGALNLHHLPDGALWQLSVLSNELEPVRVDRLSRLFGYLFHIGALLGIVFALHVRDRFEIVGALVYAGSALGAVFAGDLVTLFVFWELMAVSSVCLVWARRTERAMRSGFRYLVIQVLSGVLLLGGAAAHALDTGTLTFTYIGLEGVAGWLIFLAFGIKCAFP